MSLNFVPYTPEYRAELFSMMKEFYASPAVLHNVPEDYFNRTLDSLDQCSPFLEVTMFLCEGGIAGYGLLAFMHSNEGGGKCAWVDEIYVREMFRGSGIGSTFIMNAITNHPDVRRFRLEAEPENDGAIRLYRKLGFESLGYNQFIFDK